MWFYIVLYLHFIFYCIIIYFFFLIIIRNRVSNARVYGVASIVGILLSLVACNFYNQYTLAVKLLYETIDNL